MNPVRRIPSPGFFSYMRNPRKDLPWRFRVEWEYRLLVYAKDRLLNRHAIIVCQAK